MAYSHLLHLITNFIFFAMSAISPPSLPQHLHQDPTTLFTSCLISSGVHNFSTQSNSNNDSSLYYRLLNFSIQNLRFSAPSLPKPTVIVFPESKDQLATTVVCAREASLEIRVRCGGHSYEGTSSVAMDGRPFVVIDITRLDKVTVDIDAGHAWVEAGATLGQTYYTIAEASNVHGFTAGSCPTVGIGGHISGGGFGLLSRKYGLAADNVVDAVLVTADGELLDRDAMGEDVFWAIRGGGGGVFGVVYAWKIRLSAVPERVTSFTVARPGTMAQVADLVNKWQHVAPKLSGDFYLSSFVRANLTGRTNKPLSASFNGFYLGPKTKALLLINQAFPELKIVENDCRETSWIESVLFFSGLVAGSTVSDLKNRYLQEKLYYKAKSDYVRRPIPRHGLTTALEILHKQPKGYVILDPYGGAMETISSDSIPFPHRKGNLYSIQYLVEWKEGDNEKSNEYIGWIRGFHKAMTPYVSCCPRAAYVNYIDLDLGTMDWIKMRVESDDDAVEKGRVWGEKYFDKNYDRLVKAKTEIDPENVFRHQQSIPPSSSEMKNQRGSRMSK